ncbi:MAG: UDP-N-acetylmuramate--L-alanine ligase [Acidobacteria bacterium]|nr:UDP-N-acetylmuramate--L-alanine ligase [Acidobacteriota bacterium]
MLGRTRHVHFVGIGGIGMSGIAELLVNLGYAVSGSDAKASAATMRLETLGVSVAIGHAASHVGQADVVVVSSAVPLDNPELVEARRCHVPVIPRAEMLAELMRLRFGIAVAGAHGKTSTTSMIALMLERAGLDPTAVIGGRLSAFGSNARLGRGDLMVAEADESDGSFLKLSPAIAVVTNVDREHLDHYGGFDEVLDAFVAFANRVPFYGAVVACADDPVLASLCARFTRRVITYGIDASETDVAGRDVRLEAFGARCAVTRRGTGGAPEERLGELHLRVPGRHNLLNGLAAVATGLELGIGFDRIASALSEFRGAERRFQLLGEVDGVMVVDDYGHHPTEIAAVLSAARAGLERRLCVVFQPHRYTRTAHLLVEFGRVLATADEVVLTDIYAAGEPPIDGVTVTALAEAVRASGTTPVHVVPSLDDVPAAVAGIARPGDMVITLGAGSIGSVGERILLALDRGSRPGRASEGDRQ